MKRWLRRNALEIIVATTCIAFFGFVAVPNLWRAKQRSAQKRTMADMRTIATAWEARATDTNTYAVMTAESTTACEGNCGVNRGRVTHEELQRALVPKYLKRLPLADGWGNPWRLRTSGPTYAIRSTGSDGVLDAGVSDLTAETLEQYAFEQDITFVDGTFTRAPEGT